MKVTSTCINHLFRKTLYQLFLSDTNMLITSSVQKIHGTITGAYNGNFLFNENAPATGDYTAAPFFVTLNPNTADLQKSNYWSEEYKLTDAAVGDALLVGLYKSTDKTSTLNVYDFGTKNITDVETTKAREQALMVLLLREQKLPSVKQPKGLNLQI